MEAIIPQPFDVHTPSADINQFLDQLAHNPHNRFRIHPQVIAYESKNMKNKCYPISTGGQAQNGSSGSLLWLCGNISGIQQDGNHWHSYALIYFERKVFIIDPEYRPPAPERVRRLVGNHWHSYALIYFERKVFIIDPEYRPPAPERVRRLVGNHWHSYALIYFERKVFIIDPEYRPPAPERVRRLVGNHWHSYALIYFERKVFIIDPEYRPSAPERVRRLVDWIYLGGRGGAVVVVWWLRKWWVIMSAKQTSEETSVANSKLTIMSQVEVAVYWLIMGQVSNFPYL
ncbi:hypothetical protein EV426DRAFT_578797 [Tirmania nivea]|nr:hypothetical protein EV426DRAFT_578797 [Tirmania nivea]